MKLLALDTAMAACSVAVIDTARARPLAAAYHPMERGHAEALAPLVQQAMAEAGLGFADLDQVAVTVGPGTFTGLRIGLAFARGLGVALHIPVIGIDTLSAIAANEEADVPRLVVADARKDEVYVALFGAAGDMLRPPAVVAAAHAAGLVPEGTRVLGTAAEAVIGASRAPGLVRSRAGDLPVAATFARLATATAHSGTMPEPLYLRPADAKPQADYRRRALPPSFREAGADMAAVFAQMHGECFDNPWTEEDFAKLMAAGGALALQALEGDEPVAFLLARSAADEAEIITVGVRPFAQRRGLARSLVAEAAERLAARGAATLFLEVAASNAAARGLYGACGFSEAGLRRGYYARHGQNPEDAIVMRRAARP